MNSKWFSGVKPEEKEHLLRRIKENRDVFNVLIEYLEKEKRKNPTDYENPNWHLKQISVTEKNDLIEKLQQFLKVD